MADCHMVARVLPENDRIAGTLARGRLTRRIFPKNRKNTHSFVSIKRHPDRPGGPSPAAIAADHRAPAGGAAGWKTENGRNNPVGGEQEQDDHQHAHRPGKRLQARVGPSAGGCAAGTLARGKSARFKIVIDPFRFR